MKRYTQLILFILIFLFHFSLLFAISILVKERKISPKDFKDLNFQIEFVNVKKQSKPPEKKIVEQPKVIDEGTKDTSDDKVEVSDEMPYIKGADYPIFPENRIRSRLEYPESASEQGIEDYVVLELYIDKDGYIKDAIAVRDPGYGFAQSAVKAFKGLRCVPAKIEGVPFAVKLRKVVRFALK